MSDMTVDKVLAQIQAKSLEASGTVRHDAETRGFGELFQESINAVNETQQDAGRIAEAFEKGETDATLAEVMIAQQKASISFQAVLQVRNKLVEAYKDVMNMPM